MKDWMTFLFYIITSQHIIDLVSYCYNFQLFKCWRRYQSIFANFIYRKSFPQTSLNTCLIENLFVRLLPMEDVAQENGTCLLKFLKIGNINQKNPPSSFCVSSSRSTNKPTKRKSVSFKKNPNHTSSTSKPQNDQAWVGVGDKSFFSITIIFQ